MTAEELRPMWDWARSNSHIASVIGLIWPTGSNEHHLMLDAWKVSLSYTSHDAFERMLQAMTPEMRMQLHAHLVTKRLTS